MLSSLFATRTPPPPVVADPHSPSENEDAQNAATSEGVIAAVDLGSNSFHMVVAELRHGQLTIIDRLRESVRLAEGLKANGGLAPRSRQRALECLDRFGERLREMQASRVRAVGTNTLRRVRDDAGFRDAAEGALGHPIDIIAGVEEARLIYLGVAHSLPPSDGRRLVIDIGGGSTELIVGEGLEAQALQSLGMGCVRHTEGYFPDGLIDAERFAAARTAAQLKLRPIKAAYREAGWDSAIGASGTIRSTVRVAQALGLVSGDSPMTVAHVEYLIEEVIKAGSIERLSMPELSARRAQVWPGGLAILVEVMRTLTIDSLEPSDGALREGVLYDLVGRLRHSDARVRSVVALGERYHVDQVQATRVKDTAEMLLAQADDALGMDAQKAAQFVRWAGHLHEIGLDIAHADYHLHGAYVVANADLPGFPAGEQQLLSFLIANQRKRVSEGASALRGLAHSDSARLIAVMLRLSVLLNRNRTAAQLPDIRLRVHDRKIELTFPADWLVNNPLTEADIVREQDYLEAWAYELKVLRS
ncbi:MAG: Ppx/GppA phosphatase family protein [Pseudomonadota bacterium]